MNRALQILQYQRHYLEQMEKQRKVTINRLFGSNFVMSLMRDFDENFAGVL
jgi:hypothetical protein